MVLLQGFTLIDALLKWACFFLNNNYKQNRTPIKKKNYSFKSYLILLTLAKNQFQRQDGS